MGAVGSKHAMSHLWKQDEPDCQEPLKYDPHFGFEERKREELVPVTATKEEMDSSSINFEWRDECAYQRMHLRGCRNANAPFWFWCLGLEHELKDCYFDSYVRDMKEFERERRLNIRERRIKEKEKREM